MLWLRKLKELKLLETPGSSRKVLWVSLHEKLGNLKKLRILVSIPLIVGIFLIIYAGFGMAYFQRQAEAKDVESQIMLQRTILKKPALSYDVEQLQTELAAKEEEVALKLQEIMEFLIALPNSEQSIGVYDFLVELSREIDLERENEDVTLTRIAIGDAVKDESKGSVMSFLIGILSADDESGDMALANPIMANSSEANRSGSILPFLSYSLQIESSLGALLDFVSSLVESRGMLGAMEFTDISLTEVGNDSNNGAALYTLKINIRVHTCPEVLSGDEKDAGAMEMGK